MRISNGEEKPNYNEIFNFLNSVIQEIQIDLYNFDKFCEILKISSEIKQYAKELLFKQKDRFNLLRSREKFLIYIASFFVAYVIIRGDYMEFKKNIDTLLKIFNTNPIFICRYVDLNKMLQVIHEKGYHQYLITNSLTTQQVDKFITNIYIIEIRKFLKKLDKELNLSWYFKDYEELLDPTIQIIRECFDPFEKFRSSRYSSACCFLLSKIKKLQRVDIPMDPFYRIVGKGKTNIINHIERIDNKLDHKKFIEKYPNLGLIKNDNKKI